MKLLDLDWIVMEVLGMERTRRYETAAALATDVGHFLSSLGLGLAPRNAPQG